MTISRFDIFEIPGQEACPRKLRERGRSQGEGHVFLMLFRKEIRERINASFKISHIFSFRHLFRRWLGRVVAPLACTCAVTGFSQTAAALDLPSGILAEVQEVLVEKVGAQNWVRFRLIASEIDRSLANAPGFAELELDFPHLCSTFALPYLEDYALDADKIVISIADRSVEFGVSDPEATQYFEQFRVEAGRCVWEGF